MKTLFRNHIRRLLFFCILPDLCKYFLCLSLLGLLFFCVLPDLCNHFLCLRPLGLLFFRILLVLCNHFLCLGLLGLLFFCVLLVLCNPALVSYGEISKISFLSVLLLPARRFRTEKSPKSRFYPYFCYLHGAFVRRNLQNPVFIRTFAGFAAFHP